MTKDEALKLALDALTRYVNEDDICEGMPGNEPWVETKYMGEAAITAIKQALAAQPAPVQSCYCPNCEAMGKELAALKAQQPVQEPVAEARFDGTLHWLEPYGIGLHRFQGPLYTTPPAAQPAVPDAFGTREGEHPQYIEGWNDCRAEMLKGMKP
jgi:hypothetical protein